MPHGHYRRHRLFNPRQNPAHAGVLAGFVAALSTIALSEISHRVTSPIVSLLMFDLLFSGWIFGAVIAVCFYFILRRRTVVGAIAFILACTVACWVSMCIVTLPILPLPPIAGAVGAYLVMLAAFICFSEEEKPFIAPIRWSLWGGAFGLAGWVLGFPAFLPYSEWIVWQTGMGFVMGRVFSQQEVNDKSPEDSSVPSAADSGRNRLLARTCLLAVSAVVLALAVYKEFPAEYKEALLRTGDARRNAAKPSLHDLPEVQAMPPDQVLILRQFDDYLPDSPESGPWSSGTPHTPLAQRYAVRYVLPPNSAKRHVDFGTGPNVSVQVWEYPNVEWARYELVDIGLLAGIDPDNPERPVKFGTPLYGASYPEESGGGANYCWTSQNRVLCIKFNDANPDAVIQAYLQKYPAAPADR